MFLSQLSTERLKEMVKELYAVVYNVECFDTSDVTMLELVSQELAKRGHEVRERIGVAIK